MAVISFSDDEEHIWIVARWAFRQFLEDLGRHHPDDSEIAAESEKALALDGLHIEMLPSPLATKMTATIERVAVGLLDGSLRSSVADHYPDSESGQMYRDGLFQLRKALPSR